MSGILYLKCVNYRAHENLEIDVAGRPIIFYRGDVGQGKSSALEALLASLGVIDFPKDALRSGSENGEVINKINIEGKVYTISRKYRKGVLQRFDMIGDEGEKYNWKDKIKEIFGGIDPKTGYFDYGTYFFTQKSPEARFEYAMQTCIGPQFFENTAKIKALVKKRNKAGAEVNVLVARLQGVDITEDNYQELVTKYKEPLPLITATEARDKILETRPKIQEIARELHLIKVQNKKSLDVVFKVEQITAELEKARLQMEQRMELRSKLDSFIDIQNLSDAVIADAETIGIDNDLFTELKDGVQQCIKTVHLLDQRIKAQKERIEEQQQELNEANDYLEQNPIQQEQENKLQEKFDNAAQQTERIEKEAQQAYDNELKVITEFNEKRLQFLNSQRDYEDMVRLQKEWKDLNNEIEDVKEQNLSLFRQRLPLPELQIKEIKKGKKGKDDDDQDETHDKKGKKGKEDDDQDEDVTYHLYWNDRELNSSNYSHGETLDIACRIQMAAHPDMKLRVLIIPEGQSLGSKLDDLLDAAYRNGFQTFVEITAPNERFQVRFEEERPKRGKKKEKENL